jgi:non-ribosomal peptide synthetase component E (peptide arylation enzyme)
MIQAPRKIDDATRRHYRSEGWWGDRTFADVLERRAREDAGRIAFIDDRGSLTYAQLWSQVRRFAEFLRRNGIGRGDVVTLQVPNRVEFPVVFFALELIGAIGNKVSSDLRAVELDYILRFSKSAAHVCAGEYRGFDYVNLIQGIRGALPDLRLVVCLDPTSEPGVASFADAVGSVPEISEADRVRMTSDEVMRMCFTSGTTGNPKGVLHSFNTTLCAGDFLNAAMRVTAEDTLLMYLPVGLNWGYLTLLQVVLAGARGVLMQRFSASAALEAIARHRVTYIPTAPAAIVAMLNAPDLRRHDLASLRVVLTGGAAASVETIKSFQAALPGVKLIEVYGMLETGFHTSTRLDDDPLSVNGTVGRCLPQLELAILDDAGQPRPEGAEGEIACRGPSVHVGYLDNDVANRESFTGDDWFRTGDLGHMAAGGNLQISGRKKEIVNRGGKKYFPREIEELLYEHPAFLQVAVVGVPDSRLGERNCLCAIFKPGQSLSLDEVVGLLKGRVADYKLPEQLEVFEDFPMTPSGKIRRPELVKRVGALPGGR